MYGAFLILRYYLAESASRIPLGAILVQAVYVAKMLDPFQSPHHSGDSIRCFTKQFGQTSLEQAASGDLKKAPNLGDDKRGWTKPLRGILWIEGQS
jgi:hypothetical protein